MGAQQVPEMFYMIANKRVVGETEALRMGCPGMT